MVLSTAILRISLNSSAGYAIAHSFHANSATRLHPIEWSTGLAAGVAATLMSQKQTTTFSLYDNPDLLSELQQRVGRRAPLQWTLHPSAVES